MIAPFWEGDGLTLYCADAREAMAQMPAESVSCVVTSPPFWGLRKYEGTDTIWGGDPKCPHRLEAGDSAEPALGNRRQLPHGDGRKTDPYAEERVPHPMIAEAGSTEQGATCSLCGAWRGQLGLEPTVDCLAWARGEKPCGQCYICHTLDWIREVKRVLRSDGVFFLDIDDSRNANWRGPANTASVKQRSNTGTLAFMGSPMPKSYDKSLCLIPQRIALAAQADGWIVRSQIVIPTWMPESARDRPTDAYRTLLMLVKTKRYFYDGQAVRVVAKPESLERYKYGFGGPVIQYLRETGQAGYPTGDRAYFDSQRNLSNIWDDIPPTHGFGLHFATFPVEEAIRCILASTPKEICVKCGKARERIGASQWESHQSATMAALDVPDSPMYRGGGHHQDGLPYTGQRKTIGWTDCGCEEPDYQPGTVLDPFVGLGTSLIAARKLGRKGIGIDLSEEYLVQAVKRLSIGDAGLRRVVESERAGARQEVMEL